MANRRTSHCHVELIKLPILALVFSYILERLAKELVSIMKHVILLRRVEQYILLRLEINGNVQIDAN